jgi:hypothetical protein
MDDLVNELRNPKGTSGSDFNATYWLGLANKAADRIEQLKAALETVMRSAGHTEADIRAAIGEKKDD